MRGHNRELIRCQGLMKFPGKIIFYTKIRHHFPNFFLTRTMLWTTTWRDEHYRKI
jgi:hypothetical protein